MSNPQAIRQLLKEIGNRIFTIEFVKKNGEIRKMNCRLNVKKYTKGIGSSYNPEDYDKMFVYDLACKGYRTINLDKVKSIKCGKKPQVCFR